MKLIVWLWNPWKQYEKTRHNAWFLFLNYIQEKLWFPIFKEEKKFFWEISQWEINWETFILLKPLTFMNNSWNSIYAIKKFYKIDNQNMIIIYDDKDIIFNNIRFREEWSSGWHNGIKDIIDALSSQEFSRIKIWIAYEKTNIRDTADFVLSKFTNNELTMLLGVFEKVELMLNKWINK